ncbi:MAG: SDR family oxidoreductase [Acidimicrobiia bacterium]
MELGLSGKTAAVAAASRGLGYASAAALMAEGATVAICGRDRTRIEAAARLLGPSAIPLVADVSKLDGARAFADAASVALGHVDVLVTNTGGPPAGRFADTPAEAYAAAFESMCTGAIAMCETLVPPMRARGWGRVVAITSVAVRQPIATLILSNTARAGLTGFLKTLATEVASDGVTVNSVQPGLHATERLRELHGDDLAATAAPIPTRTVGSPDDFGAVVAFLSSDHAKFITGAAIPVDGGANGGLQ